MKNTGRHNMEKRLFTSESVTEGHPDKIADQISDAVLDAYLAQDPMARVACETAVTTGLVFIIGEITSDAQVDVQNVVRETIRSIGYTDTSVGFDAETCAVITSIDRQSTDIAQGVDEALDFNESSENQELSQIGAGDQGLMFGYATDETEELLPLPIVLAHKLVEQLAYLRKNKVLDYLRPDGKAQVTIEYDENSKPLRVDTVVVSTQHHPNVTQDELHHDIKKHVIHEVIPEHLLDEETKFFINPTGRFVMGGPQGDAGLTGRKIIVDTYGGYARHGGGAFSGKDATKVDRSASYAARYIAKNIVAAGLSERCEVQLAYAIGVAQPVSISINTFDTSDFTAIELRKAVRENFDLRPAGIIEMLDLRKPIYQSVAAYGHFGRLDLDLSWERTDKVSALKKSLTS